MKHHFSKLKRFSLLSVSLLLFIVYLPISIPVMSIAIISSMSGYIFDKPNLMDYGFNLALSYDRFANVSIFLGSTEETISSRLGRARLSKQPRWWVPMFADMVDLVAKWGFGERNHTLNSIEDVDFEDQELVSWIIED